MTKKISVLVFTLLVIVFAASLFIGPAASSRDIVLNLRFPRVFQGVIVGSALACAGVIFQGVLKNPLADPYILGTSSGALLGVVIFQISGLKNPFLFYTSVFFFALLATLTSYFIARYRGRVGNVDLILSGVIVSAFLGAVILFFLCLSQENALNILFFMMGGLYETDKTVLLIVLILVSGGISLILPLSRYLDIFAVGEEKAGILGINTEKYKFIFLVVASGITSFVVAISGTIGFIGLIVPHLARALIGPKHFSLIILSAMGGGFVLIFADALARSIAPPLDIPVGIITALFGAPFFLYLLVKKRRNIF